MAGHRFDSAQYLAVALLAALILALALAAPYVAESFAVMKGSDGVASALQLQKQLVECHEDSGEKLRSMVMTMIVGVFAGAGLAVNRPFASALLLGL